MDSEKKIGPRQRAVAARGGPSTARRFRVEAEEPFHADPRVAPVPRFRADLLVDRPIAEGIEVVRVPHGARDLGELLADDFQVDAGER